MVRGFEVAGRRRAILVALVTATAVVGLASLRCVLVQVIMSPDAKHKLEHARQQGDVPVAFSDLLLPSVDPRFEDCTGRGMQDVWSELMRGGNPARTRYDPGVHVITASAVDGRDASRIEHAATIGALLWCSSCEDVLKALYHESNFGSVQGVPRLSVQMFGRRPEGITVSQMAWLVARVLYGERVDPRTQKGRMLRDMVLDSSFAGGRVTAEQLAAAKTEQRN